MDPVKSILTAPVAPVESIEKLLPKLPAGIPSLSATLKNVNKMLPDIIPSASKARGFFTKLTESPGILPKLPKFSSFLPQSSNSVQKRTSSSNIHWREHKPQASHSR